MPYTRTMIDVSQTIYFAKYISLNSIPNLSNEASPSLFSEKRTGSAH